MEQHIDHYPPIAPGFHIDELIRTGSVEVRFVVRPILLGVNPQVY